ncbi:nucleoside-triphosphatase [Geitlerinema sp. PCC 9228]|uniref:nucleoside-triphosphatase n=1 Tax=Geitlerinema sp. PCC 9228 TaxID=111611 RepID=UPI0008F9C874|nr:nucleoside-triphosphatase [Geitlerinema sp. PCC 9228]
MEPDVKQFFRDCNPSKTLDYKKPEDRRYYIDFSQVRGTEVVTEVGETIEFMDADPTCQLFTGHIGCGKSTELLRLKAELEDRGFHVAYFESTNVLEESDIEVSDLLLAIAHQVSENLRDAGIPLVGRYFTNLMKECANFLQTPIETQAEISVGIGKLTAKAKESPTFRSQLRQYLEPQTKQLIDGINNELLVPANEKLRQRGKQGLVVIVDNLDRVDNRKLDSGLTLPEYLFVRRGDQLRSLQCHLVYTIPLALLFSNEHQALKNRLGGGNSASVLPMVPVRLHDGRPYTEGLDRLKQMVLARAFPQATSEERIQWVDRVFDSMETLDWLCYKSGGHVRTLLSLVFACLRKHKQLPITRKMVEVAVQEARDELRLAITEDEWRLLRKVAQTKQVAGEMESQTLLRSLFVFEYRNEEYGRWFDVNPLLEGLPELQEQS